MGEGNGRIWPQDQADAEQVYMQIITSGPDTREPHIRNNYLELFHKAKRHIYIQTPYFIPDDAILSALKIAASSGVDVRLMIPCKPDHPFVYWATCSYAGELLDYGARCYVYENGFLHSKGVMVDGQVSCYGTANMDIRSFELNFEVNATIYVYYDAHITIIYRCFRHEAFKARYYIGEQCKNEWGFTDKIVILCFDAVCVVLCCK